MKKLYEWITRLRVPIIVAFLVVTAFFAAWIPRLSVNSDLVSYLPATDPAVSLLHRLDERFGQNDLVLVAMESPDVFSAGALGDLARLTRALQGVDGVTGVMSLTNILDIKAAPDGGIEVGMLVDPEQLAAADGDGQALRSYVLGKERLRGSLVSADGRTALLVCRTKPGADPGGLVSRMEDAAARTGVPEALHFGGNPMLVGELGRVIYHDFGILIPVVVALIVLTLFFTFGTVRGVLVPLGSVAMSTVWLVGLMGLLRIPLTLISDIIPALLTAIGTAPCIHLLSKFDENVRRYGARDEDARAALGEVGTRILLAALTIILGFSSFIAGSYLTAIRDFGILACIGVGFSLLISMVFVPAVLASMRVVPRADGRTAPLLVRAMGRWARFVIRRRVPIIAGSVVLLVAAVIAVPFIRRESDFALFLAPDSPVRTTEQLVQREFGGSRSLQVDFTGDLGSPFVLRQMLRTERFMAGNGLAKNPVSIADLLVEMNSLIDGSRSLPDSAAKVANLMFMLEGQEIVGGLVASDSTEGQVQAMVGILGADELQRTVSELDRFIAALPRSLVVLDVSALPPADRAVVAGIRAWEAAQDLAWITAKRFAGEAADVGEVSSTLASLMQAAGRMDDLSAAAPAVLALMPDRARSDPELREDVRGVLADLGAAQAAIPEPEARTLTAPGRAAAERQVLRYDVSYTGMPLIGWHFDQSVLASQGESLALTLAAIFLLLAVKLRSWRAGLMGLAPIGLAVLVIFGLMGASGIPINVATVLTGCIALGIGIDYSIHFTVRFTTYYRGTTTPEEAVEKTLSTTGQAIVINVLTVTMGFAALLAAGLQPLRQFGLLTGTAMIASGLGALTLLPALILSAPGALKRRQA